MAPTKYNQIFLYFTNYLKMTQLDVLDRNDYSTAGCGMELLEKQIALNTDACGYLNRIIELLMK